MRVAIASGKGGAGKTSVAASLAHVWEGPLLVCDADAEAPNLHLFLHPDVEETTPVRLATLDGIGEGCTSCGACRDICRYAAIARFGRKIAVFPDMCHGCGGCFAVCPEKDVLKAGSRELGHLSRGRLADATPWISATTRVGETMTPPLLRVLLKEVAAFPGGRDTIVDCPPGVSCPAMTVARKADCVVMVADPTPFGRHDFALAYEAFHGLGVPLACVVNRAGLEGNGQGDAAVRAFCRERGVPVLAELPFDREAASAYSRGRLVASVSDIWKERFKALARDVKALARTVNGTEDSHA